MLHSIWESLKEGTLRLLVAITCVFMIAVCWEKWVLYGFSLLKVGAWVPLLICSIMLLNVLRPRWGWKEEEDKRKQYMEEHGYNDCVECGTIVKSGKPLCPTCYDWWSNEGTV